MTTARKTRLSAEQAERISRAIADPRRFGILQQIAAKECLGCGCLAEHQTLSPATISHHLKELAEAELIDVVREGRTAQMTLRRDIWNAYIERLALL
jgi:ArsR family transcriptional regulator